MKLTQYLLLAVLTAQLAAIAQAGVTAINSVQVDQSVLPYYVVSDVTLDFTGHLRGQQLIVDLDRGSMFQHPLGSQTPPSASLVVANPSLAYDTFIAIGGRTAESSEPLLDLTCINLDPGACPHRFDEQAIYVTWAPATAVEIPAGDAFFTARLALSNDAQGRLQFFSATATGTGDPIVVGAAIVNGRILLVPEPESLVVASSAAAWGGLLLLRAHHPLKKLPLLSPAFTSGELTC